MKKKLFLLSSTILVSTLFFIALTSNPSNVNVNERQLVTDDEKNTVDIVAKNVKSVVNVSSIKKAVAFWTYDQVEIPAGMGTGFVWNNKGYVVTNYHVVANGDDVAITFNNDKTQYKAEVVGVEPKYDIAVLKVANPPSNLNPIEVGTSKNLIVGQKTIAIGNPYGLDHSVSTGIISATGREIEGYAGVTIHDMIQTDASINPGNSGGPLIDSAGRLIGINTMIFSKSGASAGVGFAVPVDTVSRTVPQLIEFGKVIRPGLGITILEDEIKERFGIDKGIVVRSVMKGGPADKAGLRGIGRDGRGRIIPGDIILKIDDQETNNLDQLFQILDKKKIGETVEMTYFSIESNKVKKVKTVLTQV